jgi:protein STN1
MNSTVDIAPGQNHIALRWDGLVYYVPEVFHLSPTYNNTVKLLINDITTSTSACKVYGPWEYYNRGVIFIKNHPIRAINVFGKIVGEYFRETKSHSFITITLDDCSGLFIKVRILQSTYLAAGLCWGDNYGTIVECSGTIQSRLDHVVILSTSIVVIGKKDDLSVEMQQWSDRLKVKTELATPWEFDFDGTGVITNLDPVSTTRNMAIRKLDWTDSVPNCLTEDSYGINIHRAKHRQTVQAGIDEDGNDGEDRVVFISSESNGSEPISVDLPEDSLPLNRLRLLCGNNESDVEVVEVKSVQVCNDFEGTLGFIRYVIKNKFTKIRLVDIYENRQFSELLTNLARLHIAYKHVESPNDDLTFSDMKKVLFHRIRHKLHVAKLIRVTKSQNIVSDNLQSLYESIKTMVSSTLTIDTKSMIQRYLRNGTINTTDYKLINGIIDYVLEDLNQRTRWRYDYKTIQWNKITSDHKNSTSSVTSDE